MQQKSRYNFVDSTKGIAITLLVLYHIVNGYWRTGTYAQNEAFNFAISNIISSFLVSVFYLLGGFLFAGAYCKEEKLQTDRWLKQLVNVALLYVIYEIVYIVLKSFVGNYVADAVSISDILTIWRKSYGPYWYLYYMFFFYLIFAIPFVRKLNPWIMLPIFLAAGVFKVYGIYCLCFYLGYLLRNREDMFVFSDTLIPIYGVISVLSIFLLWKDGVFSIDMPYTAVITAVFPVMLITLSFRKFKVLSDAALFIDFGKHSMEIFLWHQPIIMVCRVLMLKAGITIETVAVVLTMILAFGIPYAFSKLAYGTTLYNIAFRPAKILFAIIDKNKII